MFPCVAYRHTYTHKEGWGNVRHLPPSSIEWFRASDDLQGSDEYGDQAVSNKQWSVRFDESAFEEMMIMTGDGEVSDTRQHPLQHTLQHTHFATHFAAHTATRDNNHDWRRRGRQHTATFIATHTRNVRVPLTYASVSFVYM